MKLLFRRPQQVEDSREGPARNHHSVTTLFAALNVLDGTVIGGNMRVIAIRNSFDF
jgi:hypothetical protein